MNVNLFIKGRGMVDIIFRQERLEDYSQTERVVKDAFITTPVRSGSEYKMVKKLRTESMFNPKLSRVAIKDNEVIGHVILSKVHIINGPTKTPILSLGLVSITPSKQRQGIGTDLINNVLSIARDEGEKAVIVLGHPTYYAKLGFKRASNWGIKLPFEAPDEAFFALELMPHSLRGISGVVEYPPAFFGK